MEGTATNSRRYALSAGSGARREWVLGGAGGLFSPAAYLILVALGILVAFSRMKSGAFLMDDWSFAATSMFHGFAHAVSTNVNLNPRRPLTAAYFPVLNKVFGLGAHGQLIWAVAVRIATSAVFYTLLVRLRVGRLQALAAAALALIFPWSDATWMWISASSPQFSVLLTLTGAVCLLVSMSPGRTHGTAWFGAGEILFVLSLLTYEVTLPLIAAATLLPIVGLPRRRAVARAVVHVAVLLITVVFVTLRIIPILHGHDPHQAGGLSADISHLKLIVNQSGFVFTSAAVPFRAPHRNVVVSLAIAIALVGAVIAVSARDTGSRTEARRALALVTAGIVVGFLGYLTFVPADPYYSPMMPGVGDRTNVVAAFGYALVVVGLVSVLAVVAGLIVRWHSASVRAAMTVVLAVILIIGWARIAHTKLTQWNQASMAAEATLTRIRHALPHPPRGSTIVVTGEPLYGAPDIPIFATTWDLNGALELLYNDSSLRADPLPHIACGGGSVTLLPGPGAVITGPIRVPYGGLYAINVANGTTIHATDRAECAKVQALPPPPVGD